MLTTVKAIYEDGKVIFNEPPPVTERTEVMVTFLEVEKEKPKKRKLGGLQGLGSLPDDFDEPLDELKEYM